MANSYRSIREYGSISYNKIKFKQISSILEIANYAMRKKSIDKILKFDFFSVENKILKLQIFCLRAEIRLPARFLRIHGSVTRKCV